AGTGTARAPARAARSATEASLMLSSSGADVAQSAQALALLRAEVDGGRSGAEAAGRFPAGQRHAPHRLGHRSRRRGAVALARIRAQIVPFLPAHARALAIERQDGLPSPRARAQEELVRAVEAVVGLAVPFAITRAGEQAAPLHRSGDRHARAGEHRGSDVEQAGLGGLPARRDAGPPEQQRDAHDLFVQRLLMLPGAMLEELLAVVGGHEDERPAVEAPRAHVVEDAAQLVVHVPDLAVVERDEMGQVGRGDALPVAVREILETAGDRARV